VLFNSYGFVFAFLPIVLLVYSVLGRRNLRAGMAWLALASLFFYAWWDWRFLPLFLASIVFNFHMARAILSARDQRRTRLLQAALAVNLLALAWFKYANFLFGTHWNIPLPIGISFFTFTQIAFLVDCWRGEAKEADPLRYTLFVSYFPHLVAGPVLHHKEMMPQFGAPENAHLRLENLALGISIFIVGLAKKVLIADNLSPMVGPAFAGGAHPQLSEAWMAVLAYTFQLYFDFSGYSDMAIGLSLLFGVWLPLNFASPYKARNITTFWRCWHMTLSRFLRDYLYIPLGGNRQGKWRQMLNLMLTMLLGGLWHGAGWTFVLWGGLHGLYLVVHHAWRERFPNAQPRWWHWPLTFLLVMLAWVPFRAPDMAVTQDVLSGLTGLHGLGLPYQLGGQGIRWLSLDTPGLFILPLAMLLAFYAPNTQELFARGQAARWRWQPSTRWALGCAALLTVCLFSMNRSTEFLYFQF
jgi:D-alanyl-lipoteichoic acid acyltransferase DltB (MBOAT superfamily)